MATPSTFLFSCSTPPTALIAPLPARVMKPPVTPAIAKSASPAATATAVDRGGSAEHPAARVGTIAHRHVVSLPSVSVDCGWVHAPPAALPAHATAGSASLVPPVATNRYAGCATAIAAEIRQGAACAVPTTGLNCRAGYPSGRSGRRSCSRRRRRTGRSAPRRPVAAPWLCPGRHSGHRPLFCGSGIVSVRGP